MGKIWTLTEGTDALVQSSVHTAQWSRPPAVSTVERNVLAVVEPLPWGGATRLREERGRLYAADRAEIRLRIGGGQTHFEGAESGGC